MTHLSLVQISGVSYYDFYEKLFEEADVDRNGIIPALQAAKYLKRSGLSDSLLSKIWDQADVDKKGELRKQGFFMALKLIALAQQGTDPALANLISDIPPPRLGHPSGGEIVEATPLNSPPAPDVWEIPAEERAKYEALYLSLSPDGARLSGEAVRPLMLQSGLPTDVLVTIWDLADVDKDGYLDHEEFLLAMQLTQRRMTGKVLPDRVPPAVVARMKGPAQAAPNPASGAGPSSAAGAQMGFENHFSGFADFGSVGQGNDLGGITCESESLLKEVEEIKQQKLDVDLQVLQLESDLKLKQAEMKVMQRELDHMSSTYLQLEVQKEEAQKRLDELADTSAKLRMSHEEYKEKIRREEETIADLKGQMSSQEMSARSHEEEIAHLRSELNDLMVKESLLQEQLSNSNRQVAALQRENQQSEEELRRAEAKTGAMMSNKSQLEEVLTTLNALMRGETVERPLPPDDFILGLFEGDGIRKSGSPALANLHEAVLGGGRVQGAHSAEPQPLPARPPSVPTALSPAGKPSGLMSGAHHFRPASASPQAVPFTAHFPSPAASQSAAAAAWPPVGTAFVSGPAPGKGVSATMGRQNAFKASFGAGGNTMPPAADPPAKTKSKKSKSPFSRSKKPSSSSSSSGHHDKRQVPHQQSQETIQQPGVGDFADFSRFDGPSRAKACPSEDEQLAWAKMESQRMQRDEEKKRRQEEADLQLAIQLSKMNS